ncbi:MAG: hypothetical protein KBG15_03270 [Kofleriaceae bacterium]|nr:hypothetical protein [Kofleriaceae bacterium]
MNRISLTLVVSLFAATLAACGSNGTPTGSVCPPTPLTYSSFGKTFFDTYCTRCHSEYKTEAGIKRDLESIDLESAKGPNATNTSMPESGTKPTDAEREMLGQFLACSK